jgi:hypothetical protein
MAEMSSQPPPGHGNLGPELRRLAQTILERLDPALRAAATLATARSTEGPGKCQQVWCPVCAVAALATGEEHPLLTVVAEHSVELLTMVRAILEGPDSTGAPKPDPDGGEPAPQPPDEPLPNTRYQHIPINIEQ